MKSSHSAATQRYTTNVKCPWFERLYNYSKMQEGYQFNSHKSLGQLSDNVLNNYNLCKWGENKPSDFPLRDRGIASVELKEV